MEALQIIKKETVESLNDAMNTLYPILDEGLNDYENGRVVSEEDAFKMLDNIQ